MSPRMGGWVAAWMMGGWVVDEWMGEWLSRWGEGCGEYGVAHRLWLRLKVRWKMGLLEDLHCGFQRWRLSGKQMGDSWSLQ